MHGERPLEVGNPSGRACLLVFASLAAGDLVVELARRSSSYYAPSAAVAEVADSIHMNLGRIFSLSLLLDGEYGARGAALHQVLPPEPEAAQDHRHRQAPPLPLGDALGEWKSPRGRGVRWAGPGQRRVFADCERGPLRSSDHRFHCNRESEP